MAAPEWLRRYWYPTIRCLRCPRRGRCDHWERYRDCIRGSRGSRPGEA